MGVPKGYRFGPRLKGKRPGPQPANGLTLKQKQVLSCVGEGYSTKEIATEMNITTKAVENHIARINDMFNVWHNKVKLARIAIAFGLSSLCLALMVGCSSTPVSSPVPPPPPPTNAPPKAAAVAIPATSMMLLAKPQKSTTVTMGWNMVPFARDYSLLWSTNQNFANSGVVLVSGGQTQARITGLTVGKVYYFAVRANVNDLQSYPSPPVSWKAINWSGNSPAPIP